MKPTVSKLWRWNRFVTWVYHITHGIEADDRSFEHLKDCKHCKEGFEKWQKNRMPKHSLVLSITRG